MRVIKVLNNSLVLALNDEGQEIILMGKGIGFQKTIGYKLSPKEIDKVFVLKDRELSRRIIRLAAETDSIYFEMAKSVIDYAVENYHMKLMDHIYLALTDHLAFAAKRIRNGVILQNFYTLDMKKFNPREFQVGEYAVQLMSRKLKVEVPLDEAGNIAFHFINAQYDNPSNSQNLIIAHAVSAVLDIVKYTLGLTYNEDSLSYSRYVTHIRLFVQRLVSHNQLPEDTSPLLYDQIAPVCQKEFACVDKIQIYVSEQFQTQITNQERLYNLMKNDFFFHIGKSIQRLYLDEIFYFACNGKKIEIHTEAGVTTFYGTMQEVVEQVDGKGFWTIHKSYIVNSSYVSIYKYDAVQMTDGTILPISQKYRKLMKSCLTELYRKE